MDVGLIKPHPDLLRSYRQVNGYWGTGMILTGSCGLGCPRSGSKPHPQSGQVTYLNAVSNKPAGRSKKVKDISDIYIYIRMYVYTHINTCIQEIVGLEVFSNILWR